MASGECGSFKIFKILVFKESNIELNYYSGLWLPKIRCICHMNLFDAYVRKSITYYSIIPCLCVCRYLAGAGVVKSLELEADADADRLIVDSRHGDQEIVE
jgi:hypothetical protein